MPNDLVPYRPAQSKTVDVVEVVHRVEVTHYDGEPWPDLWFVKVLAITFLIVIVGGAIVVGFELAMLAGMVG